MNKDIKYQIDIDIEYQIYNENKDGIICFLIKKKE